ncbi:MAG: hypothetical protein RIB98_06505 [Acidimicrobiales bacterium]
MTTSAAVPPPIPTRRRRDRRAVITFGIVALTTVFLVWTMSPWAWFVDSTPTGGDMGAHVWAPKFLREELLPNFRLTGWSPDWYAGFPAFTFYMIVPSLAIAMVNVGIDFSLGPLHVDPNFYAFVGVVLAAAEVCRRRRVDPGARLAIVGGVAAASIVMSWRYDGRLLDPGSILPWSPVDPFTYNDASIDLAVAGLLLPAAVGSVAHHLARDHGRWRGVITAAAVIACVLVVPIPYGVAMKMVAISGIVTLPLAAYAAGRLGGLAFPGPALLSLMTLPFLFDRSFNIYGGNVMSTMAGEFAFSMGLSIAVLYIGFATRGMATGRNRVLAGGLLALAGLTHLFAAFFGLVVTVSLFLLRPGKREVSWLMVAGPIAGLLSAFWVLPFYWNTKYLNDMGWGKEREYVKALWSRSGNFGGQGFLDNDPVLQVFIVLAVIGAVVCGVRRVRLGMALSLTAAIFAIIFLLLPEGRLWNVRILPFYYLSIYLMAGIAIAEVSRLAADFLRSADDIRRRRPTAMAGVPAVLTALVVITMLAFPLRSFPTGSLYVDDGQTEYGLAWAGNIGSREINLGPGWMRYNFEGYEARPTVDEYRGLIATMDEVGREYGCGQSLWEYDGDRLGGYGTPMAPMLLPHWTDGCIGSMEGLYFEASATTPYHFLLQSELSTGPSRAMRDMPYSELDVAKGVAGLRAMGVRYYMAATESAVVQARAVDDLTEIATSGPWVIFLVEGQSVVEGLDHLPVVVDGVDAGGEEWLIPTVAWWESGKDTPLVAADGPGSWPQSSLDALDDAEYDAALEADDRVLEMRRLATISDEWLPRVDSEVAQVTDLVVDTASISFDVDRIGLPVLVRASYFPNWDVAGADGPYRVAPNLMVVIPTDTRVELTYGRSGVELFAMGLTVIGLVLALLSRRVPRWKGDSALWDLTGEHETMPDRIAVLDAARAGELDRAELARMADEVATAERTGRLALLAGSAMLAWSALLFVVSLVAFDGLTPGGDKLGPSLVVFGPGVVGVVVLLFAALPVLSRTTLTRSTVLGPARMMVEFAADRLEDPTPEDVDGG